MTGRSLVGGAFPPAFNWGATGGVFASLCCGSNDGEDEVHSKLSSAAGTYSNLALSVKASNGVITLKFRKNTADGNQVVVTSSGGTGYFTDATNSDACADGDKVALKLSSTGSTTEVGPCLTQFDATSRSTTFYSGRGCASSGNNGGNYYFGPGGGSLDSTATGAAHKMTTSGTLSHATTWETNGFQTFKSVINGATGNLSVISAAGSWAEDSTHSDTFAAGDLICMHTAATSTERTYHEGMRYVTDGSGCQEFMSSCAGAGNINSTSFIGLIGGYGNGSLEADVQTKVPFSGYKLQSLRFYQYAVGTGPVTVTSRVNGANGNQTVTASSGSTGRFTDVTNSDTLNAGDKACARMAMNSGGSANIAWVGFSMIPGTSTETSTGVLAFGPLGMAGQAQRGGASTASLAFGPLGISGRTVDQASGRLAFGPLGMAGQSNPSHSTGALAFGPLGMAAAGSRSRLDGRLAFGPLAFAGLSGVESGAGLLRFGPLGMAGASKVPGAVAGAMAFGPLGIEGGGFTRTFEMDVAALCDPATPAHVTELDVAALTPVGAVDARVYEFDVSVVAVPNVTTGAAVEEIDVAVLAYIGPCATNRCTVWRIERRDGQVFAFTSLDTPITWRGTTYSPCKSLTQTAQESSAELKAAGDVELTGILDDEAIKAEDLYSGLFDDAYVEAWVIPYDGGTDDQAPFRIAAGNLGKVTRGEYNFTAEVVGPGGKLAQAGITDVVSPGCRWDFGVVDSGGIGCPVNASSFDVVNIAVTGSVLRALVNFVHADPGGVATWDNGKLIWQTGRNAGTVCQVETVDWSGAVSLWDLAPYPPAPGDLFTLRPGCPKTPSPCKAYGAFLSFGGFPDVPGPDALQSNADSLFT